MQTVASHLMMYRKNDISDVGWKWIRVESNMKLKLVAQACLVKDWIKIWPCRTSQPWRKSPDKICGGMRVRWRRISAWAEWAKQWSHGIWKVFCMPTQLITQWMWSQKGCYNLEKSEMAHESRHLNMTTSKKQVAMRVTKNYFWSSWVTLVWKQNVLETMTGSLLLQTAKVSWCSRSISTLLKHLQHAKMHQGSVEMQIYVQRL